MRCTYVASNGTHRVRYGTVWYASTVLRGLGLESLLSGVVLLCRLDEGHLTGPGEQFCRVPWVRHCCALEGVGESHGCATAARLRVLVSPNLTVVASSS
eukprot:360666-Chlamydomonas_euryale.AAC.12